MKLAINGFGRIGRASFKIAFDKEGVEIVAINDLSNPVVLAQLLQYDTVYGVYSHEVGVELDGRYIALEDYRGEKDFYTQESSEAYLVIDKKHKIRLYSQKEPAQIPWSSHGEDVVVLECTGVFVKDDAARAHLDGGAKKVVVSAPTKGGTTKMFIKGVNSEEANDQDVISNASCTTNCVAPVISVLNSVFGVEKADLTTVHAVTSGQNLVDGPPNPRKPDLRRARAAPWNMIPTGTGAAKATTKVIPDLEGRFDGSAIRVPLMSGSLSVLTALLKRKTTVEELNEAFIQKSKEPMFDGVLGVAHAPLVSSDIVGSSYSAIVDLNSTMVTDGDFVKVLAWYDNEWGYSTRLVEMALL